MSDTVVDSSVVAKWILPETDSAQAQRLITEVALKGERLIILDLAFVEVVNAVWKRFRRGLTPCGFRTHWSEAQYFRPQADRICLLARLV